MGAHGIIASEGIADADDANRLTAIVQSVSVVAGNGDRRSVARPKRGLPADKNQPLPGTKLPGRGVGEIEIDAVTAS